MIFIIFIIGIISALGWIGLKNTWFGSIGSSITAALVSWIIASGHYGFFGPTVLENSLISALIGIICFVGVKVIFNKNKLK
jgi:hypothetical protein